MRRSPSVTANLALRADRRLGAAVGRGVRAHHRRRLERVGWLGAVDAPGGDWAAGEPRPRPGGSLEVLIDGAEALPRMVAELERAESHVHIAGWFFSPDFALTRGGEPAILRDLLAELAERVEVRVLVWAGAPLPLFRPSRGTVRKMRERLCAGTKIRCALDAKERPMHCHHEKTIVVDDRVAFVGGIDLTSEAGDRFDSSGHRARGQVGWHDASARVAGPAVADIAEPFRVRWRGVSGEEAASAGAGAEHHKLELVGGFVQGRDRVADLALFVGVGAVEVVADRVDDDEPDVAELERRPLEPVEIGGHPERPVDDRHEPGIAGGGEHARPEVELDRILGGDDEHALRLGVEVATGDARREPAKVRTLAGALAAGEHVERGALQERFVEPFDGAGLVGVEGADREPRPVGLAVLRRRLRLRLVVGNEPDDVAELVEVRLLEVARVGRARRHAARLNSASATASSSSRPRRTACASSG